MAYTKYAYTRVDWKNKSESLETPLGKTNLNRMDSAIYQIAENVDVVYNEMDAKKLDKSSVGKMLSATPTWDADTGILTFQFYDGTEFSVDFNIEKIPVSFSMDSSGLITMTTADGTQWTANIADMIPDYVFEDSDTIAFTKTKNVDGSYSISADVKKNSLTELYFEPNYLSNVTTQASKAEASANSAKTYADNASFDAKLAQSYAVGGSGIRDGEDADNAKLYAKKAKEYADKAGEIAGGNFITQSEKGIAGGVASLDDNGKIPVSQIPDDISVNEMTGATGAEDGKSGLVPAPKAGDEKKALLGDGTWGDVSIEVDDVLSDTSENPVQNKVVKKYVDDNKVTNLDDIADVNTSNATDGQVLTYDATISKWIAKDIECGGGGISLENPTNVSLTNADESVVIKWTDPDDIEVSGIKLAEWEGTLVVRKVGSAPTSKTDGVVVVDSKTRNQYDSAGFVDNGLTNGTEYYYGIFPYTKDKKYNYDYSELIVPSAIYPSEPVGIALKTGDGEIKVSFIKPDDATGIRIVYGTTPPTSETDGTIIDTTESPYTITNLTNGTEYYVRVYSYNAKNRFTGSTVVSATPEALKIVTWADGSWDEISAMLDAHYNGEINIWDYWSVGDVRQGVPLSAIDGSSLELETQTEQTIDLVIIGINHDKLTSPVGVRTKSAITVNTLNCLDVTGRLTKTYYTVDSSTYSKTERYQWMPMFKNALPSHLSALIKTVNKDTTIPTNTNPTGGLKTEKTNEDCFLLSNWEVFGQSYTKEGSNGGGVIDLQDGEQYEFFKTVSNRFKSSKGHTANSTVTWYTRSGFCYSTGYCCYIIVWYYGDPGTYDSTGNAVIGIAPAFCL